MQTSLNQINTSNESTWRRNRLKTRLVAWFCDRFLCPWTWWYRVDIYEIFTSEKTEYNTGTLDRELGMYRYRWASGYAAFQTFKNDVTTDQPWMGWKWEALLHTRIVLLQSRHNVGEIRSLRWVCRPATFDEVRKCRLTARRQRWSFVLPMLQIKRH